MSDEPWKIIGVYPKKPHLSSDGKELAEYKELEKAIYRVFSEYYWMEDYDEIVFKKGNRIVTVGDLAEGVDS